MRKQILSMLVVAAAAVTFNVGTVWTQTAPDKGQTEMKDSKGSQEPGRTERKKGEEEMEARGAQKPGRMGKPGAAVAEAKESRGEAWAAQDIKQVQEALKNKGHDPGSIDGVMGPQTRQAIRAFQNANGLKASGRLDGETAEKLGIEKKTSSESRTSSREATAKQKEPSAPTGK